MISFAVSGHPEAQGSYNAFCPVSPNADINDAIHALRNVFGSPAIVRCAHETADRLAAIGKWPVYVEHEPGAKTPGHFVATMRAYNSTKLGKWRNAIAKAAREAYGGEPIAKQGVRVDITYFFRRPKCHYRTGRFASELRDDAPADHWGKPDRDKLNRAVGDALTGIIFVDDSQDFIGESWKVWRPNRDQPEGAKIKISWDF